MRLRYIITLLLVGALLSGTALAFLFFNVPPSNVALPILLTLLLAFSVFGLATSFLIFFRSRGDSAWRSQINLSISVRQGFVIGLLAALALWLAYFNVLRLWIIVPIILVVTYIEYSLLPESLKASK